MKPVTLQATMKFDFTVREATGPFAEGMDFKLEVLDPDGEHMFYAPDIRYAEVELQVLIESENKALDLGARSITIDKLIDV